MPKIVDHDARRRAILDTFLSIVAEEGLSAATTRAVASRLGVATGALWHYFPGLDSVLSAAFDAVYERTNDRIERATAGRRGLDAVASMFGEILPLTKETQDEARIVVGFWGRIASNPELAASQALIASRWRDVQRGHLEEAIVDGELASTADVDALLDVLGLVTSGAQVDWVTGAADAARLQRTLAAVFNGCRGMHP